MNNYKEASRTKLRVDTSQGQLSVEQLWDLSLNKLTVIIRNINKQLKNDNDDNLSFLDETKVVDKRIQLIFDILKDIYSTKKEELDAERKSVSDKEHNQKIFELIKRKQDEQLINMSIDELQSMLKE
jgi:hypothetical protein